MNGVRQKLGLGLVKRFTEPIEKEMVNNLPAKVARTRGSRPVLKVSASKVYAQREWEKFEKTFSKKSFFAAKLFDKQERREDEKLEVPQTDVEESNDQIS